MKKSGDPSEYALDFFKREGFIRKKCIVGGEYFWTLNPEQEHCNDVPCVDYYFWRIPRGVKGLDMHRAREKFVKFFERHGHTYIEPRPTLARWRDDLYLTIASIVVFQPHVTSGIVEPPANPLVIVQPSIRLEDIDNVGLTLGRHLTSFEMAAHHAFNYPNKYVYWKEETVEYAFQFFTKELGIPPEHITFKESWWEGGGNAGPSFEVTVGGLELATLVFMQYKVTSQGYEPLPLKIVDTGYGVERIAWFTQDVPTAFHAVYGSLLDEFYKILGVTPIDQGILWAAVQNAGSLDPEDPLSLDSFYKRVASATGLRVEEVREALRREAAVYALLDHSKTIALMLSDGAVPSNAGEGYLVRLVTRRALRLLNYLNTDTSLVELVEKQARYWGRDYYPRMMEMLDYILKIVMLEEERYKQTLERSLRELERLLHRKKSIGLEDLIVFYDSHGIPPDIVSEVAGKYGASISVPHNFYALVARRHGASGVIVKTAKEARLPQDVVDWASSFPETQRLYHEDQYMREFTANILGVKGVYLVLDKTAFYPTSGGQIHDTGVVTICGRDYKVVRVEKTDNNVVVHVLDKEPQLCGEKLVRGVVDWERRYRAMRHHTAVHVLLGALRRVLGEHVWQAGAEKTPEKARLDVTHYELPSRDEVKRIEELANKIILERVPVEAIELERNTAEKMFGMRLYQGGAPLASKIRVVKIGDWDAEACSGTHVANTAEIGSIKIVNVEKLQDGVIRFELVAGSEVARYASEVEDKLLDSAGIIDASPEELDKRLRKLVEEFGELKKTLSQLRRHVAKQLVVDATSRARLVTNNVKFYLVPGEVDVEAAREAMRELSSSGMNVVGIVYYRGEGTVVELATSRETGIDLRRVARELSSRGFRGGGKEDHVTLYTTRKLKIEELEPLLAGVLADTLTTRNDRVNTG